MSARICTLCGSSHLKLYRILRNERQIFVCQNCTNALTYPRPDASYEDHPFFSHVKDDEDRWRSYSKQIAKFIQRYYSSTGSLLDVGCSHGLLLEETQKIGFAVQGIEPSHSAAEYCLSRGLQVHHGYLVDGMFPAQSFDVVVMSHVIEHVSEPMPLLKLARDILSAQGVLCLCQTNYQGTLPRYLGQRWNYWVEHEHYYHFSLQGIRYILEKAGFEVIAEELLPLGYPLNLKIENLSQIPSIALEIVNYGISRWRIGWPFQGDQMYILARPLRNI